MKLTKIGCGYSRKVTDGNYGSFDAQAYFEAEVEEDDDPKEVNEYLRKKARVSVNREIKQIMVKN